MNGSSLLPFLECRRPREWRDSAYAELDFGEPDAPTAWQTGTGSDLHSANLAIIRERRFKLVHFNGGLPPASIRHGVRRSRDGKRRRRSSACENAAPPYAEAS